MLNKPSNYKAKNLWLSVGLLLEYLKNRQCYLLHTWQVS